MYQNSFAITPGESLTPQQLFDRFIDWTILNQSFVSDSTKSCDSSLKRNKLCCPDHIQHQVESDIFYRYFRHLGMLSIGKLPSIAALVQNQPDDASHLGPFTVITFASVISTFNLKVDRKKYKKAWGSNSHSALNFID